MLDQTQAQQAPVLLVAPESFEEVFRRQMQAKANNPYAMSFLYWMYGELLEEVYERLTPDQRHEVDTLIMLNTYIHRAEYDVLTGMDADNLTVTVAEATRMMTWD